jgi:hypothetical protein
MKYNKETQQSESADSTYQENDIRVLKSTYLTLSLMSDIIYGHDQYSKVLERAIKFDSPTHAASTSLAGVVM